MCPGSFSFIVDTDIYGRLLSIWKEYHNEHANEYKTYSDLSGVCLWDPLDRSPGLVPDRRGDGFDDGGDRGELDLHIHPGPGKRGHPPDHAGGLAAPLALAQVSAR